MIDDEIAARLCLLTMPGMGPARLGWLTADGSSVSALASIKRGQLPTVTAPTPRGVNAQMVQSWQHHARQTNGQELLDTHRQAGIQILVPGDEAWPYENDPEPPSLLFTRGRVQLLGHRPMVGIVGTRRCSSVGRRVARQLGSELASAGVAIVSGLALGIDGAAHVGALDSIDRQQAPVVGVVATGLDVVYPKKHGGLWDEIAERGLLISEAPLGTLPQRWRFPARNRLLAGLCDLVVVVESHESGGALSTVEEAVSRSVEVVAVPGSVLSAASAGSNALLFEGCAPVRSAQDVLGWLGGGAIAWSSPPEADRDSRPAGHGDSRHKPAGSEPLLPLEASVLTEVSAGGLHLDVLFGLLRCSLGELLDAVQRLEIRDLVELDGSIVTLGERSP